MFDKVVVVTKKTLLEELVERFNSKEQARFYIEHSGSTFSFYESEDTAYKRSLDSLKRIFPSDVQLQFIERDFLPNFLFGEKDLVVTLGPDGLVINTAKYLNGQPILAINPDINIIDGVLIPFTIDKAVKAMSKIFNGKYLSKKISMAKAELNDGQVLYGVNDLFIGPSTHISFRYKLDYMGMEETQSSSGIIVSTGAGSTGWFKSIITGASGIHNAYFEGTGASPKTIKKTDKNKQEATSETINTGFPWDSPYLVFSIREPFPSKISRTKIVYGAITQGTYLKIESHIPQNGVIFSDGILKDYLEFNSGKIAKIGVAEKQAHLIT